MRQTWRLLFLLLTAALSACGSEPSEAVEGAAISNPADPLVSERQYPVNLRGVTGPGGFGLALVGSLDFTAP